jgi:6-phosphogluconolactonase
MSADRRYLLAVDAGSNQISVLRILPNGRLLAWGSPVSSNGSTPLSIAVFGPLVYVANAGAGASNYTGFVLDLFGGLHSLPGSTFALPDTASPGEVLFSGDGRHLIGTRVGPAHGPSSIDSFRVGLFGHLVPAPGSPFAAQRIGPFGSAFRPTNPDQLFVSNAHDGADAGSVSAYNVSFNGTLTPIGASPFADNQTAPCWVEISHDGRYLFAVNTAVPSISSYSIDTAGSLTLLGSVPFNNGSGLKPFDAQLDPSGNFLYVVAASGKVSAFSVSGGTLTELGSSPVTVPGGGAPFGIVVD